MSDDPIPFWRRYPSIPLIVSAGMSAASGIFRTAALVPLCFAFAGIAMFAALVNANDDDARGDD